MLIQPTQQNNVTQVTTFASSASPTGVEQERARADVSPVTESEKNAASQNKLFASPTYLPSSAQASKSADNSESKSSAEPSSQSSSGNQQSQSLTDQQLLEDQALLTQLKARDREVRLHEAAHAAVGGRYAGAPNLEYTRGPDGNNYATGGEVSISTSAVSGDPQTTIEKARVIRAAALAPAQPSSQDRQIAAQAAQLEAQARVELQQVAAEDNAAIGSVDVNSEKEEEETTLLAEDKSLAEENKPDTTVAAPVISALTESSDDSVEAEEAKSSTESDKPDAREELEKILLGSLGLLQQANQLGLVDPTNPYGKSGYLDIIA